MKITSLYPVLATNDVTATADFFRHHFGFDTAFESDWYVSLSLDSWELAILRADHPTVPEAFRGRTAGGLLLNIEVPDVDALHDRLLASGLTPVLPLRSEEFGQRHAIFAGPEGVLIDVITPIPPSDEYAARFSAEALDETRAGTA
ncbi:VOC family protein [Microbacterium sp. 179-I 3D3 NHS]|uniref:VOC family protein n=1 Tax=Microbacterium sp. 179-I 3D3 NHS TaxID=3142382 RepID=UPI00399F1CC9